MAQLIDPIFGNISGRLGDFVFMTKNGKTFMYYRPKLTKKPGKPARDEQEFPKRLNHMSRNDVSKRTKKS